MSQWHCRIGDRQYGPLTTRELKELADTGQLHPTDLLKKDGTTTWAKASAVRGLFAAHEHDPDPLQPLAPKPPLRSPDSQLLGQTRPASAAPVSGSSKPRKLSPRDLLGVAAIAFSLVLIAGAIWYAVGGKSRGPLEDVPVPLAANVGGPQTPVPAEGTASAAAKVGPSAENQDRSPVAPPTLSASQPATNDPAGRGQIAAPAAAKAEVISEPGPPAREAAVSGDVTAPGLGQPTSQASQTPAPKQSPMPPQTPDPAAALPIPEPASVSTPPPEIPPASASVQPPPPGSPPSLLKPEAARGQDPFFTPPAGGGTNQPSAAPETPAANDPAQADRDKAFCDGLEQLIKQTRDRMTDLKEGRDAIRKIGNDMVNAQNALNAAMLMIQNAETQILNLTAPPVPGAPLMPLAQRGVLMQQAQQNLQTGTLARDNALKLLNTTLPNKLTSEQRSMGLAVRKCNELLPDWVKFSDPFADQSQAVHIRTVEVCGKFLADEPEFIAGYLMRGFAHSHVGETDSGVKDFDQVEQRCKSIRTGEVQPNGQVPIGGEGRELMPGEKEVLAVALAGRAVLAAGKKQGPQTQADSGYAEKLCPKSALVRILTGRANALLGKIGPAVDDFEKATTLNGKEPAGFRELAWLLATTPTLNQGKRAADYGRKACELTDWNHWQCLDAYALACAASASFEEAVKWGQKSLETAPQDARPALEQRLKLYQAKSMPTNVKHR